MITSLSFLGAGAMAEALLDGILSEGLLSAQQMTVMNRANDERLADFSQRYGVRTTRRLRDVAAAEAVLLCVKPKDVAEAVQALAGEMRPGQTLISVAAGVPSTLLESWLPNGVAVVRAMPNTSAAVRRSATAFSLGKYANDDTAALARWLFGAIGTVLQVREAQMDAVTAVSGSGPAYVYLLMELLTAAAVELGLSEEQASRLVTQTFLGAAVMAGEADVPPKVLRQRVTSPGGTTEAALRVLEEGQFHALFQRAVARASERAGELAAMLMEASAGARSEPRQGA